jgi:Zn-dependent peptidase ImmA (M78 family)/transcriptional regulator with XRE-family HTH domain
MTGRANPDILVAARESRGASQSAVADAAGISQGMISKAENGLIELAADRIEAIAQFLHYPVALFYEPGRTRVLGSGCLYHRKRKTLPARLLKALNARMELRRVGVRRMLRDLDIDAERMFHTMDPDEYGGSPEQVAQALRAAWRIPAGPVANMTALIESAGGVILTTDFGTNKLMGMSCWERDTPPLFYLNDRMSTADLRWTMAHELGHLVMHAVPPVGDPEEQADAFAGEFLAPRGLVVPDLRKLTFDRLYPLKMVWRLSIKALIMRAQRTGAIDQGAAQRLYKQYSARGYNAAEPYPLPPEPQTLIPSAIDVHLRVHGYTPDELSTGVALLYRDDFTQEFAPMADYSEGARVVSLFGDPSRQRA